jgi:hypothetical protein
MRRRLLKYYQGCLTDLLVQRRRRPLLVLRSSASRDRQTLSCCECVGREPSLRGVPQISLGVGQLEICQCKAAIFRLLSSAGSPCLSSWPRLPIMHETTQENPNLSLPPEHVGVLHRPSAQKVSHIFDTKQSACVIVLETRGPQVSKAIPLRLWERREPASEVGGVLRESFHARMQGEDISSNQGFYYDCRIVLVIRLWLVHCCFDRAFIGWRKACVLATHRCGSTR